MKSIRIKNFRSLKDTGNIELKPITLLVGKNSSGKSSFLRIFPLFKQSVEERTKVPVLLYSRSGVDFGSYRDVKSFFSSPSELIEFEFTLNDLTYPGLDDDLVICIKIDVNSDDIPVIKNLELRAWDNNITIQFDTKESCIEQVLINDEIIEFEYKFSYLGGGLIVDRFRNRDNMYHLENYAEEKLRNMIKTQVRKGTSDEKIISILHKASGLTYKEDLLAKLKAIKKPITWSNNIKALTIDSPYFKNLYHLIILKNIENILRTTNYYLREIFHKVKYIGPVRATAERYYRIQDLSVDEVDPYGQNLPMFLGSLTSGMMKKFQTWTHDNFSFMVKIKKIEGHYSIKIVYGDSFEVNISDMGFGYSQILPIITQLWYSTERRILRRFMRHRNVPPILFVIEQPELHLHPEFQAKFADAIVKTIHYVKERKINMKLIIETHSQTLVNRLGQNISEKRFGEDNINIIIFNKLNEDEPTTIQSASFDSDGLLENWPVGFFRPTSL